MRLKIGKKPEITRQTKPGGHAKVFSYYASRSTSDAVSSRQYNRSDQASHRRRFSWQSLPIVVAALVILGSIAYVLWIDIEPRIEIITSSKENTAILQNTETYQRAGREILSKSPFNRIKLTVDTNQLAEEFKKRFPELSEVVITTPLAGHRLIFEIQPTTPALALSTNSSEFIVLDERGRALFRTAEGERIRTLSLPVILDESGIVITVGDSVLPAENIQFITEVIKQLQAQNIAVQTISLPQIANELYVRPNGQQYYVKFNMVGDARLQSGAFVATKQRLEGERKVPTEYIDVRTEEKVYYK